MLNNIQFIISAPSGAGKTTIIKRLLEESNNIRFSVSTTTRTKRTGEKGRKSYNFVSEIDFKQMIENEEFVEWAIVHGNYYGTTKKEIDRITRTGNIPIFDVDVQGAKSLKKILKNAVLIFIIPPSLSELKQRLRKRKTESEEAINIRFDNALKELKEYYIYDFVVINDDLDKAVNQIKAITISEQCRIERVKQFIEDMGVPVDYRS